jgi:hypothetical protein
MVRCHHTAEEGDGPLSLVQDPDVLQLTMKGRVKSGRWSTGVVVSAALRESNADAVVGVHRNVSFFNSCVHGAAMSP